MLTSGVLDDRLIKRIGAWPDHLNDFVQFFRQRRLGPFAYARGRWKGQTMSAVFPRAARVDLASQCVVQSVSPVFGNGKQLPLNQWSWIASAESNRWSGSAAIVGC
jgi:hypothetical protein